ncbi:MAG TPA: VTT domain-containing protein [Cyclobacteriaceae bacterium]|nr:VTT domain-containing protein [Cyclobacteriaceae bacterium]HRG80401.1 VTT domain-containing protein [Cyclobacteriaceae bacterium]
MEEQEETHSSFLFRNLIKGLLWFAVIITVFILLEGYIQENFKSHIDDIRANPGILYGVYTLSEIVFGILPPELFMMIWILDNIDLAGFIINLSILTVISYGAGILGYYIGKTFSKTPFYQNRIREKYLKQYEKSLKKFGGYLVFVGAVTPVPFSATCMLAGSVNMNFRNFLLICITRVFRFAAYGWMIWRVPEWFNG